MPRFVLIALLFFAVPLLELGLLIRVGGEIGVGWTLTLVILTAIIGAWLLRLQGLTTLQRAQRTLEQGAIPALEILEGVALLVAGALLLTPGFITDAIGFALLLPPLRQSMLARIAARMVEQAAQHQDAGKAGRGGSGRVIEGEFRRED